MDSLVLLALSRIKGIAEAGATFAPAEHGLSECEVAELLACGAAEAAPEVAPELAETHRAAGPGVKAGAKASKR